MKGEKLTVQILDQALVTTVDLVQCLFSQNCAVLQKILY